MTDGPLISRRTAVSRAGSSIVQSGGNCGPGRPWQCLMGDRMAPSGVLAIPGKESIVMLSIRTASCALAGLVLSILSGQASAAVNIPDPDAVDAVLDRFVDEGYYPFIYARLEDRDGNVVYEHGAVNRDLLPDADIDGQTWIRIWSMSKIVTISTVLDLVEDGVLNLEDPVADYIPEFADMQVAVTADGRSLSEVERERGPSACPVRTGARRYGDDAAAPDQP